MHTSFDASPRHGSDAPSPRPLANQLVYTVSRFARFTTQATDIPISAVSMRALSYIDHSGPKRIAQLAKYESISQPGITTAVNRLADQGYVVRKPDPKDARAQLVNLTAAGREVLAQYRLQLAEVLQPLLGKLTPTDIAAIEHTVQLLESMTDQLAGTSSQRESS